MALQVILEEQPDMVVSGINHGPNMGEDVTYSGTVAAAFEGTILGLPSIAVSALQRTVADADTNGRFARMLAERVLDSGLPEGVLLNVNIPNPEEGDVAGVKVTRLGSRAYFNFIEPPGGRPLQRFYTIGGESPVWKDDDGSDIAAVRRGYVSVTPLNLDLTDYRAIVEMERWRFDP
jgi:5'-nucleotidase